MTIIVVFTLIYIFMHFILFMDDKLKAVIQASEFNCMWNKFKYVHYIHNV